MTNRSERILDDRHVQLRAAPIKDQTMATYELCECVLAAARAIVLELDEIKGELVEIRGPI